MTRTQSQKQRAKQARNKSVVARRQTIVNTIVQKPKTRKQTTRPKRRAALGMSKCAYDYLKVLENPFSGAVACIPTQLNFPSMKHNVFIRGSFLTSATTGTGAVMVCPWACLVNGTQLTSDNVVSCGAITTQAAYTGNNFPDAAQAAAGPVLAPGVAINNSNSPYAVGLTGVQMSARLVACGLRIRNVTPLLNKGGNAVGLEATNHYTLANRTFNSVSNQSSASLISISDDKWHSVVYHPDEPEDTEYMNPNAVNANNSLSSLYQRFSNYILGFLVAAQPNNTQTFQFEVNCVFEAKGTACPTATASESDPIGMATVQNLTSSNEARKPKEGDRQGWLDQVLTSPIAMSAATVAGGAAVAYGRQQTNRREWSVL